MGIREVNLGLSNHFRPIPDLVHLSWTLGPFSQAIKTAVGTIVVSRNARNTVITMYVVQYLGPREFQYQKVWRSQACLRAVRHDVFSNGSRIHYRSTLYTLHRNDGSIANDAKNEILLRIDVATTSRHSNT